jgi:hypothetical protein
MMRVTLRSVGLVAISWLGVACDNSTSPSSATIQLSQSQAAILVSRISQIAPVHPELAWLADSVDLVLKSGAEANLVAITTDLGTGPFWAVGLQRSVSGFPNSFATFDFIIFNNPSDPTDFIIIDGYHQVSGPTPPQLASGSFSSSSSGLSGHMFQVVGSTVSAWRAEGGGGTLENVATSTACPGFQPTGGVTCDQIILRAAFTIGVARHDNGVDPNDTRSAEVPSTDVAGIVLHFQ